MIAAIEGVLQYWEPSAVILKVGPVSLRVHVPTPILNSLGSAGKKVSLHTYLYVREDVIALYGFSSVEELGLFQNLISVSGVGPKVALGILSSLTPEQLSTAIVTENIEALCQVPGIGKKIAGRLIVELKSKIEKGWQGIAAPITESNNLDVVAALTSLGYSSKEALQAVTSLGPSADLTLEERVRLALRQLGR